MNKPSVLFRAVLSLVILALTLSGCVLPYQVKVPSEDEFRQVTSGDLAIVLYQVAGTVDGKPLERVSAGGQNNIFRTYLANIDKFEVPQQVTTLTVPTKELGSDGWAYMLLEPGNYFLLLLPPGIEQNPPAVVFHSRTAKFGRFTQYEFSSGRGGFWHAPIHGYILPGSPPEQFEIIPGFWFHVSANEPVQYIGSLSATCTGGRGLFGSLIDVCSDFEVSSAPASTLGTVQSAFPGTSSIQTSLAAYYGNPSVLVDSLASTSVELVVPPIQTPVKAEFNANEAGQSGVMHGVGLGASAFNLLTLLSEAGSAAHAEAEAKAKTTEYQDCTESLGRELLSLNFSELIHDSLMEQLAKEGTTLKEVFPKGAGLKDQKSKLRFEVDVVKLNLRECSQTGTLCPELAMRIRAKDMDLDRYIFDAIWVYTDSFPQQAPLKNWERLYQIPTTQKPTCLSLETWCGNEGPEILREEIDKGVHEILSQFTQAMLIPAKK